MSLKRLTILVFLVLVFALIVIEGMEHSTKGGDQQREHLTTGDDQQRGHLTTAGDQQPEHLTTDADQQPEHLITGDDQQPEHLTTDADQQPEHLTTGDDQQPEHLTMDADQKPEHLTTDADQQREHLTTGGDQQREHLTTGDDQQRGQNVEPNEWALMIWNRTPLRDWEASLRQLIDEYEVMENEKCKAQVSYDAMKEEKKQEEADLEENFRLQKTEALNTMDIEYYTLLTELHHKYKNNLKEALYKLEGIKTGMFFMNETIEGTKNTIRIMSNQPQHSSTISASSSSGQSPQARPGRESKV